MPKMWSVCALREFLWSSNVKDSDLILIHCLFSPPTNLLHINMNNFQFAADVVYLLDVKLE